MMVSSSCMAMPGPYCSQNSRIAAKVPSEKSGATPSELFPFSEIEGTLIWNKVPCQWARRRFLPRRVKIVGSTF
ncbi:hypothetical protein AVEN_8000-1, partial [Araneus ventricosus]